MVKSEKPNTIAVVALCVSITTAGFSIYQWWYSQRENRISAAIEISKKFQENSDTSWQLALIKLFKVERLNTAELTVIYRTMLNDEYLAFLINRDRIDQNYLSRLVQCQIYISSISIEMFRQQTDFAEQFTEIARLGPTLRTICEPEHEGLLKVLPQSK